MKNALKNAQPAKPAVEVHLVVVERCRFHREKLESRHFDIQRLNFEPYRRSIPLTMTTSEVKIPDELDRSAEVVQSNGKSRLKGIISRISWRESRGIAACA